MTGTGLVTEVVDKKRHGVEPCMCVATDQNPSMLSACIEVSGQNYLFSGEQRIGLHMSLYLLNRHVKAYNTLRNVPCTGHALAQ